jgi:hypothetical protein
VAAKVVSMEVRVAAGPMVTGVEAELMAAPREMLHGVV